MFAGERMAVRDVERLRSVYPDARLFNLFGPTETNVSCAHEILGPVRHPDVPIGRPCPYLDVELVDHRAGVRPATRDRMPFVGLHPQQSHVGIFNGFGSKGSLMIPWHARQLANYLANQQSLSEQADIRRYWQIT